MMSWSLPPGSSMSPRALLALPMIALLGCPPADGDKPDDTGLPSTGCTDADGDGYCEEVDCDDGDPEVHPDVEEESMGPDDIDNDCDGVIDECSEDDPELTWHAEEVCDGIDNDCDGEVDEDLGETWYPDLDGDGYGDPAFPQAVCDPDAGLVQDATDCDDGDAAVHPGALEVCNGHDDDCDLTTVEDGSIAVDGVGGFATIQQALDEADEGATVSVCAGTWAESLTIAQSVTLEAPAGPDLTVLTAAEAGSVIRIDDGTITVQGFAIGGGTGTDISSESDTTGGGGILAWNADELLVQGCVVSGNEADYGGGILGPSEGLLSVEDSTISGNHASIAGGGVYVMEGLFEGVDLFENSSDTSGGGIYHYQNALMLIDCTITDNSASYGGGMRAFEDSVDAETTLFEGNSAEYGGGVYMRNDAVISGLELRGNSADRGAGVYCREDGTLSDSVLSGNVATSYGGGAMCRDDPAERDHRGQRGLRRRRPAAGQL
jgi:predicted outer membrane repeat protein